MIGYNVDKIEELAKNVAVSYKNMGECMAGGWPQLSRTMEAEWVGPDEVSYEQELAKNICSLYASCQQTVEQMLTNIRILGNNWKQFQLNNSLEGASVTAGGLFSKDLEIPNIASYSYDIASLVKAGNPQFTESMNLGLTNGISSGANIKSQFDEYIDGVYDRVKKLYTGLDTSSAFLGAELSSKLTKYLDSMAESLAKLTTCHKSIYEALDQLTKRYSTHESEEANTVASAETNGIDYQGQNLK